MEPSNPKPPVDNTGAEEAAEGRRRIMLAHMVAYGPALKRYFMRKVSASEADDLVQEVFLNMQARGAGAVDLPENIQGYLFRTAANVLVTHHRRGASQGWSRLRPMGELDDPADDISPERVLIGRQAIDRVVVVLQDLPPRTRQAFLMHRFEELTYAVIAQRMGVSVKAVEAHIMRAIQRLGRLVEEMP